MKHRTGGGKLVVLGGLCEVVCAVCTLCKACEPCAPCVPVQSLRALWKICAMACRTQTLALHLPLHHLAVGSCKSVPTHVNCVVLSPFTGALQPHRLLLIPRLFQHTAPAAHGCATVVSHSFCGCKRRG
jgi:hypothetical protein